MSRRSAFDLATTALFLGAISAPLALAPFEAPAEARVLAEQRTPAPLPARPRDAAELARFPSGFESWWADRFGLREEMLAAFARVRAFGFGVSPTSTAVLGEDRWVYLTASDAIAVFRGLSPMSAGRLDLWRRSLESRRAWCEARGIEYLFVLVPEKSSIYPDKLPASLSRHGPTRTDQLLECLRSLSDVVPLDLRPALLAERERDRGGDLAYLPYGVHWTERGAYAGYFEILRALRERFPRLRPIARDALRWEPAEGGGENWASRLHLEGLLRQESWTVRGLDRERARFVSSEDDGFRVRSECDDAGLPRLVMLHDSFGEPLREYLAQHFSHAAFLWNGRFDPEVIEAERPDIVVEAFAERVLVMRTPDVVRGDGSVELARAFEGSRDVLLALDVRADPPALVPRERADVARAAGGVEIRSREGSGTVLLPEFRIPDDERAVLRLEVSSPVDEPFLLLYRTGTEREYLRRNHYEVPIERGRHVAYVELEESRIRGPMLLCTGPHGADYVLHGLEVRALRTP
jgi:hypothetical protein